MVRNTAFRVLVAVLKRWILARIFSAQSLSDAEGFFYLPNMIHADLLENEPLPSPVRGVFEQVEPSVFALVFSCLGEPEIESGIVVRQPVNGVFLFAVERKIGGDKTTFFQVGQWWRGWN